MTSCHYVEYSFNTHAWYQLPLVMCDWTNKIGRRLCNFCNRLFVRFLFRLFRTRIIFALLSHPMHWTNTCSVLLFESKTFWTISFGRFSFKDLVFLSFDFTDVITTPGFPSAVTLDTYKLISFNFLLRFCFLLDLTSRFAFKSPLCFSFRSLIRIRRLTLFISMWLP